MRGPRLAAVLLVGGAAAASMAKRHAGPERAGDSDAGPAGSSALRPESPADDDTWAQPEIPADPWAYEQLVHGSDEDDCGGVGLLPHNEVCVPHLASRAQLERELPDTDLGGARAPDASIGISSAQRSGFINVGDLPSFYLHNGGLYNFTDSVLCLLNATGLSPNVDTFDDQWLPDMAEHMVDWWLLKRFERHPSRVFDPDAAQLHVIGSPFTAAYRAHRGFTWKNIPEGLGGPLGCGDIDAFYGRTAAIADHIKRTPWWKQHGGRNFLMLNSFYYLDDVLGQELLSTLVSGPVIFTSSDRNYKDYLVINETVTPIVVPYKAHYQLEDYAWARASSVPIGAQPRERTRSVMYHGSTGRGFEGRTGDIQYVEGGLRQLICDRLGPELAGNSLRCIQDQWKWKQAMEEQASSLRGRSIGEYLKTDGSRTWIAPKGNTADPLTLEAYLSSKLCLAPAGDTPTSRRLFDSMAAGCLPVLMAPAEDIMPNLPFPKAIDWPQTVLFGGGLSCSLSDNADATIRWLQSLLKPENEKKLQCMARRAQKVFLKYLTLRDEGVVSALLNEIDLKRVLSAPDAAPDAGWLLELAAPGTRLQCSAGRRGATEEECLAAVREAASREGLEVVGLKSVKDGEAGFVPIGCSYSSHTKTAMFNTNADGGDRAGSYRLACRGRGAE